ncbi:hypothetical protein QBC44DRAFT_402438 [Cladorrhinum sp. PSN332]|nr:hypothetical protein QBC44DRAFT_402438 [Cladorrhinum sp. PSN332]
MVSPLAFLSRFNRDENNNDKNPPGSFGVKVRRNKLRKRPSQAHSSQLQTVAITNSNSTANQIRNEMGNHLSFENIPRPSRPPRPPLARRVPSLPCLPIYETFTVAHIEAASREEKLAEQGVSSSSGNTNPAPSQSQHRSRQQRNTTVPAVKPGEQPLTYDRALQLADSYRSILPDYDVMGQEDDEHHALRRQQSEQNLRRPHLQVRSHTSCALRRGPHAGGLLPSLMERDYPTPATPQPPLPPARATQRPATAPSVASSSTAVGSEASTGEESPRVRSRQRQAVIESQKPLQRQLSQVAHIEFIAAAPEAALLSPADCTRASVALQICSKLLTDELTKVLAAPKEDEDQSSSHARAAAKLQVLMMTEAYEGLLEHWKDEISSGRAEAEGEEKLKCAGDVVDILNHWLASLHAMYQDEFGKEEN